MPRSQPRTSATSPSNTPPRAWRSANGRSPPARRACRARSFARALPPAVGVRLRRRSAACSWRWRDEYVRSAAPSTPTPEPTAATRRSTTAAAACASAMSRPTCAAHAVGYLMANLFEAHDPQRDRGFRLLLRHPGRRCDHPAHQGRRRALERHPRPSATTKPPRGSPPTGSTFWSMSTATPAMRASACSRAGRRRSRSIGSAIPARWAARSTTTSSPTIG